MNAKYLIEILKELPGNADVLIDTSLVDPDIESVFFTVLDVDYNEANNTIYIIVE